MPGPGFAVAARPLTATSLPSALAARARAEPEELAILVDGGDELTFGAWEERSGKVASGLAGRGVAVGDRVALRFGASSWTAFAVAYTAVVEAGAVAVLVPAGLADPDARRIITASGAVGVLCSVDLVPRPASAVWTAHPDEVAGSHYRERATPPVAPTALAELSHPLSPMIPARPRARTGGEVAVAPRRPLSGWLVHTWAPGSPAGQQALAHALVGNAGHSASLARFTPAGLCALVARLGASSLGITPGLADALLESSCAAAHLASVSEVVLSGERRDQEVLPRLAAAFSRASVVSADRHPDDDGDDLAPAGASQLGMLWHEQLAPGSFNLPCLVRRYRGSLDIDSFGRALAELTRRHEPLRTNFELRRGDPRLVVRPSGSELAVVDLEHLPPGQRDVQVAELIAAATTRPFDLVASPLFAPHLVRLAADDHLLVVRLHHTAFDDWSVEVFRRELSSLYASFLAGEAPTLPDPVAFSDVCRRQRARVDGDAGAAARAWWREQMTGSPFAAQLSLGEPEQLGPDRPGAGEPLHHDLDPDLARRVRALSRGMRATPFMTTLAAFGVLLSRRTGQDDLVLASVVAGRSTSELEPLIGCLTKKVLLRLRLDGDPTFRDVVNKTRSTVLGALSHQDLPFEAVVQEALGRAAAAHGVAAQVPVVFQGETPQRARLVLPGIRAEPYEAPAAARREQHFSTRRRGDDVSVRPAWGDGAYLGTFLLLSLLEAEEGLSLVARGVFHRPAAVGLLRELETLLEEVVAAPDRPLAGLGGGLAPGEGELLLRGLRLSPARLEEALARCPGVSEVAVAVTDAGVGGSQLVAYVVADRHPPPTLAQLRATLWAVRPGSPWPAAAVLVDALPRGADGLLDLDALPPPPPEAAREPAPEAALLTALWSSARGEPQTAAASYWQDFAFLQALAEARAAGLAITDDQVTRSRTPEMLAAAMAADAE